MSPTAPSGWQPDPAGEDLTAMANDNLAAGVVDDRPALVVDRAEDGDDDE